MRYVKAANYLVGLQEPARTLAVDYIRKAPADVVTPVRTKAAAALECLHALQGRNIRKSP